MSAGAETMARNILASAGFTAEDLPGALRLARGLGYSVFYLDDDERARMLALLPGWRGFFLSRHRDGLALFIDRHRTPRERAWIIAIAIVRMWCVELEVELDEDPVVLALLMPSGVFTEAAAERGGDLVALGEDFGVDEVRVQQRFEMLAGATNAAA